VAELERESPVPYYLQIEERLRDLIESDELAPMSRVPSEIELAARFGVSRMTARKSIDRLVNEGFLFRRQGKGTFVAAPRLAHPTSTQTSFSAAMQSLGKRVTTTVLHAGLQQPSAHVARDLRLGPGEAVVHIRRLRIVDGEPTAIHTSYLPPRFQSILRHDLTGSLIQLLEAVGARVTLTRDSLEAIVASPDDAALLDLEDGAPLMRLESVGFGAAMEPVRYTDSLYRGDRFRFVADTSHAAELRFEVIPAGQASG
jgi:GntR family transcriptional regulator